MAQKKEIQTDIIIDAPKEKVWAILTDFESFPQWNPFVIKLTGKPQAGARLEATLQPAGQKPTVFKPVLQQCQQNEALSWLGSMPLNMFNGYHYFRIEEVDESRVKFIQGEKFSGWLSGPVLKKVGAATHEGFIAMNKALKQRAEKS